MIGCNARGGEVHITFLNQFSLEEFAPHFETIKAEKEADDKWVLKGRHRGNAYTIKLHHVQGDAVCEQDVETVLALRKFHVAIILGTQASKELTSKFEDSRVLHCCMLLRNLAPKGHHIRIVSENNVDQTSLMAIIPAPPDTGELAFDRTEPDFVNTQATFARALTLTLGYPGIGPAVNELFDEDNKKVEENALRNPEMDLLSAGELGITSQKLSFTAIQKIISDMFHSSDMGTVVALGYFQSAAVQEKLVLSPPSDEQRLWWKDDMIILICRRKKRHSTQGVSNIADTPPNVRRGGILGNLVGAVRASGSGEQSPRNVEQPAHCQSGVIDQACA